MSQVMFYPVDPVTKEVSQIAIMSDMRGGVAHIPSNALNVKPLPEKQGFVVIATHDLTGSEYLADFRNKTIYNKTNETETIESKDVVELGEIESGWTLLQPLPFSIWENEQWVQQLTLLQKAKVADVNAWRHREESSLDKVLVNNINWDADTPSRARIESVLQSEFTPPFWTDANNVDQPITRTQLKAITTAIAELGFNIHARQREMKADITQRTTCESVNDYVVDWPATIN